MPRQFWHNTGKGGVGFYIQGKENMCAAVIGTYFVFYLKTFINIENH